MKRPRILVVDDEPDLAEVIAFMLVAAGYDTAEAHDGDQAFVVLSQGGIDLVVSDVRMPHSDGLSLLARLRAVDALLPVILISGYADLTRDEARARGAVDLLPKPTDFESLNATISKALGNSCRVKPQGAATDK